MNPIIEQLTPRLGKLVASSVLTAVRVLMDRGQSAAAYDIYLVACQAAQVMDVLVGKAFNNALYETN